ncbi:hypothetical protein P167DRAFT_575999 [Morchella conica CCBAS932]|uniref:Uncharacterized protein n=1 Tax=Morchella conica CCBAS932 TaxID=1392247 RepID=A0A3N4KMX5_9PEZI|nr:hypothetical protein P167DRAFT_575999 [Morchella conica CCBAS932]
MARRAKCPPVPSDARLRPYTRSRYPTLSHRPARTETNCSVSPEPARGQIQAQHSVSPQLDADGPTTESALRVLSIGGHIFNIPKDPLKAFHAIRSQIISSFVDIFEGTAGARDIVFISVTPTRASMDPTPSKEQRIPTIDGHIFNIPADPVGAFQATRQMTLAAYKRIAPVAAGGNRESGTPDQRDMAFISGTATLAVEEHADLEEEREVPDSQDSAPMRNTESPPPADDVGTEVYEVDDEDDQDYRPSASVRRNSAHTILEPTIDLATTNTASTTTPLPRARLYLAGAFLGDYTDFAHAQRDLGKRAAWVKGKYVDGLISLGGKYAITKEEVGTSRCRECRNSKDDPVCRVLGGKDQWLNSTRCGLCLVRSVGCHMP